MAERDEEQSRLEERLHQVEEEMSDANFLVAPPSMPEEEEMEDEESRRKTSLTSSGSSDVASRSRQ